MNIFFLFHHFTFNYLHLSFVIFSLFLLFDYSKSESVKLTRIDSRFYLTFFIKLWFFLLGHPFKFFFSYSDFILRIIGLSNYPELTRGFPWHCIFWRFVLFSFDIRLLGLKLYKFLFVFLKVLLISYLWLLFS
jgi:hypothetical protein